MKTKIFKNFQSILFWLSIFLIVFVAVNTIITGEWYFTIPVYLPLIYIMIKLHDISKDIKKILETPEDNGFVTDEEKAQNTGDVNETTSNADT